MQTGVGFFKGGKLIKTESVGFALLRLLGRILLAELLLFVLVGVVCWFGGWRTLGDYAIGLMYGGMGAILLGGVTAFGGNTIARDPTYRYIQSDMHNSLSERTSQDWKDNLNSINFMIWVGVAGLIAVLVGYLLNATH
jgi:hypothetical protein